MPMFLAADVQAPRAWKINPFVDMGKTTVEILDRGEETPRYPPVSGHPSGDMPYSAPSEVSQVSAAMIFVANHRFTPSGVSFRYSSRREPIPATDLQMRGGGFYGHLKKENTFSCWKTLPCVVFRVL